MSAHLPETNPPREWSIEEAESLLASLSGVLSSRIVTRPGGDIEEIHVLTTEEVGAKQTVRNVESALLAHFNLTVDHRKISVAQTSRAIPLTPPTEGTMSVVMDSEPDPAEGRILFEGHRKHTEPGHRIRVTVTVRWQGERYEGSAISADLPRPRLEAVASATLRAIEAAITSPSDNEDQEEGGPPHETLSSFALDGVKIVDAFEREFALVAVHAMTGRGTISLAGASAIDDNVERAVILATLQASDRWARGKPSE